jgi:hypothetical protein
MPRLYRPHIPVEVKCRVVLRQMGELWPNEVIGGTRGSLQVLLKDQLEHLAALLGCAPKDLRLDHDPALAVRDKWPLKGKPNRWAYHPDANDPEFLIYRTAHDHHLKTNVRGDGAQFPDRVLIKRARKQRERPRCSRCHTGAYAVYGRLCGRCYDVALKHRGKTKPKYKWGSRPLRSASRWPKRKFK